MTTQNTTSPCFYRFIYFYLFIYFWKRIYCLKQAHNLEKFCQLVSHCHSISNLNREMSKKFPHFCRMLIKYILLAPQGLDQEYILHKPPAAQVLMEPSQPFNRAYYTNFYFAATNLGARISGYPTKWISRNSHKTCVRRGSSPNSKRASNANHSATKTTNSLR